MIRTETIKPTQQAIKDYYAGLQAYAEYGARHEGATETAFSRLLADTAKAVGWTLIPKQGMKVGGKHITPDGTLRDAYNLPRGYWEAKDTDDDLDTEIGKKIAKQYPLINTVFEDTRQAVLYQNGVQAARFDLTAPQQLADLLNQFYGFTEPDIEGFEQAVTEFQERVPELATGLAAKVRQAHDDNRKFQEAFAAFFQLCQTSLNPNIRRDAVDEMLVQHLLTERLFRKIFHDEEFTRRNIIASEVEKVIAALVSRSFSRDEFLKSLDRFYKAIEAAAETIEDFTDKQHFLNTVYERFFQGYSVRSADTHGIVYTPQPIVDFMCASIEEVLRDEFGLTLGSPEVTILDPCTGTGNFVVNMVRRVPGKDIASVYEKRLFANEVLLLAYYIAALNIEHAYYEKAGAYEPFEGLCFVDTLDLVHERQPSLFSERNTERVEREKFAPITVILGNPPYNANQVNENDNNRNRQYPEIDRRIRTTYAKASRAQLKNKLYDPYVKFIRWATDRLDGRDGVICYVTNHSFAVDEPPFDGVRKTFQKEFTSIRFLDLHGNVRQNQKLSGTTHNVFGIQTGVGISILVRKGKVKTCSIGYYRVPETWRKEQKLEWLAEVGSAANVPWQPIEPDDRGDWLVLTSSKDFDGLLGMDNKPEKGIFGKCSTGAKSNRDEIVYGFGKEALRKQVQAQVELYNAEVDRLRRHPGTPDIDEFLEGSKVKWSSTLKKHLARGRYATYEQARERVCLYRPYTKMDLYYDAILNDRPGIFRYALPDEKSRKENVVLCCTNHSQTPFSVLATNLIANEAVGGRAGTCFPFYLYDQDGSNRRENITDWGLKKFRGHYKSRKMTKWDVFHYIYGLLHHPGYRARYADILKRELPRIPFAPDFQSFAAAGKKLMDLHVNYEDQEPYPLRFVEKPDVPLSYVVTNRMKLSKDKTSLKVNDTLTLADIPPEAYEYRIGTRSALEWVIAQYRVTEDTPSGVRSDPNRPDDPEYIVCLIGKVVRVSLETARIVKGLPTEYAQAAVAATES